ncbi:MAG: hypothetical protein PHF11_07710, partial [Candidatus Omnitrophica bacterium]|nr:hypothetical protein [Candidatus Omnitrophota bacterium]
MSEIVLFAVNKVGLLAETLQLLTGKIGTETPMTWDTLGGFAGNLGVFGFECKRNEPEPGGTMLRYPIDELAEKFSREPNTIVLTPMVKHGEIKLEVYSPQQPAVDTQRLPKDLKWEEDQTHSLSIDDNRDTRPEFRRAIAEGRLFAIRDLTQVDLSYFFRGSSEDIAERFSQEISNPGPIVQEFYRNATDPEATLLENLALHLRSPPARDRLKNAFLFLQKLVAQLGSEQISGRRFAIILEPGFETNQISPTIIYKGDCFNGRFASLLSHGGTTHNSIYLGLNTLEFAQVSQYHQSALIAVIRHENQDIYHGHHLPVAGMNRARIFSFWADLFCFVRYQNQLLTGDAVVASNVKQQLILREAVRHLNRYKIPENIVTAANFKANRHMRVVMRPAGEGQEAISEEYYSSCLADSLNEYDRVSEHVTFDGCQLPSDSGRFAHDLVGILEGYKTDINGPHFTDDIAHNFVTDGGLKTRMFALTIQRVFQGLYRMYNEIFLGISYLSQQVILAQFPRLGRGYTLIGGSDNIICPGALTFGIGKNRKPLAELPKEADVVLFGAGTRVPLPKDIAGLRSFNANLEAIRQERLERNIAKDKIDEELAHLTAQYGEEKGDRAYVELERDILNKKLCDLGLIASTQEGRLVGFKEKGNFNQVVDLAIAGNGQVMRNAFCIAFNNTSLKKLFD